MIVLAANTWAHNGELIDDCRRLGYLHEDWLTLDPTGGSRVWWKTWKPRRLIIPTGHDFRDMKYRDDWFDAVTYDPPYVCIGGRDTSKIKSFHERYGLIDAPRRPLDLQQLIDDGLRECERVLKPGGYLLVKCQDYVTSGRLFAGAKYTWQYCVAELDMQYVDEFIFLTNPRPQPPGRKQVHARRNFSVLYVFRKVAA